VTATDGSVKQQKKHFAAFFRRYSVCTRGFDHTDGSTRGRTPVLTPDAAASDPACVRSAAVSTAYHPMGMSIWYFRCTPVLMPGSDKSRHTGRHRFVSASNCGSVVYDHWTSHAATSYRRRGARSRHHAQEVLLDPETAARVQNGRAGLPNQLPGESRDTQSKAA